MIMFIILIRHLYLKVLSTPHFYPESQMMFTLIAIIHVDYADLNVLIIEEKSVLEVIEIGQRLIDVWKFALSVSVGDLNLEKCSWKLQCYYWNEGKCL